MIASHLQRAAGTLVLPLMIAALPAMASAQSSMGASSVGSKLDLTEFTSMLSTLPSGESLNGGMVVGSWIDPSFSALGSMTASLYDEAGQLQYDVIASVSEYIAAGSGQRFGGISGQLYQHKAPLGIKVSGLWSIDTSSNVGSYDLDVYMGGVTPTAPVLMIGSIDGRLSLPLQVQSGSEQEAPDGGGHHMLGGLTAKQGQAAGAFGGSIQVGSGGGGVCTAAKKFSMEAQQASFAKNLRNRRQALVAGGGVSSTAGGSQQGGGASSQSGQSAGAFGGATQSGGGAGGSASAAGKLQMGSQSAIFAKNLRNKRQALAPGGGSSRASTAGSQQSGGVSSQSGQSGGAFGGATQSGGGSGSGASAAGKFQMQSQSGQSQQNSGEAAEFGSGLGGSGGGGSFPALRDVTGRWTMI